MECVPVRKCPTSILRKELNQLSLSPEGTRTQLIDRLHQSGVNVVYLPKEPPKTQAEFPVQEKLVQEKLVHEKLVEREFQEDRAYSPLSPYIPIHSLARSGQLLTDAAFSVVQCTHIRSVESLQVSNIDVVTEIEDIRELKRELVENYLKLKRDIEHVRHTLESTFNRDLYMYNISKDITWTHFEHYVHCSFPATVQNAQFFGKVEDSTIHANLHFELLKEPHGTVDKFYIDLPAQYDAMMSICPVMTLVNSNYHNGVYLSESTTCNAFIRREEPNKLIVFCPILLDSDTRLQFDITLRYFGRTDPNLLTPTRLSSMWHKELLTERGHRAIHQWTVLDDRVELFTNVELSQIMDGVDTVQVDLPAPCSDDRYIDIMGYAVVVYQIHDSDVIYSNNTPLVRISQADPYHLVIKSSLLKAVNNWSVMTVASHIVYNRKIDSQLITDFAMQQVISESGRQVRAHFRTTVPVNAYYFRNARAVTDNHAYDIPLDNINGFQSTWHIDWTVPTIEQDTFAHIEIELYDIYYRTSNAVLINNLSLTAENVRITLDQTGPHDVSFWFQIQTPYVIPFRVNIQAEFNGETHAQLTWDNVTTDSEPHFAHLTHLYHNSEYSIRFVLTDPIDRSFTFFQTANTLPVNTEAPLFYRIETQRVNTGVSVSAVFYPVPPEDHRWYVFASNDDISIHEVLPSLTPSTATVVAVSLTSIYTGDPLENQGIYIHLVSVVNESIHTQRIRFD